MSTEITIIKDVERLISSNEINQSDADKLLHNLDAVLFSNNSDSKKFGVLLKIKIVSKLFCEVTELENKISNFSNSRSQQREKGALITKNDILSNLIIALFQTYSDYLSDSEEYRIFEDNRIHRIETICQNLLNENINDNDPFPEYYDKSNADKIISEIEEYYKSLFQTPENTIFVKTKLLQLSQSIKLKVSDIESKISISKEKEDEYRKKLLTFSNEQSEEKDRTFDLYDCEANEIMNMFQYKTNLISLYDQIIEEYPFVTSKQVKNPDAKIEQKIEEGRSYHSIDRSKYDLIKKQLPCFTLNFSFRETKCNSNIKESTGFIYIDLDGTTEIDLSNELNTFLLRGCRYQEKEEEFWLRLMD